MNPCPLRTVRHDPSICFSNTSYPFVTVLRSRFRIKVMDARTPLWARWGTARVEALPAPAAAGSPARRASACSTHTLALSSARRPPPIESTYSLGRLL